MLFTFFCLDKPDAAHIRKQTRAAHIEYMLAHFDRQVFGGPLLDDDGKTLGSLICMECRDRSEAEAFLANEPYARSGLFARVDIFACRQMVPEIVPGFIAAELERERQQASALAAE